MPTSVWYLNDVSMLPRWYIWLIKGENMTTYNILLHVFAGIGVVMTIACVVDEVRSILWFRWIDKVYVENQGRK